MWRTSSKSIVSIPLVVIVRFLGWGVHVAVLEALSDAFEAVWELVDVDFDVFDFGTARASLDRARLGAGRRS